MKINFNFTLDEFQAEALLDCIQSQIVNLTSAKLDHISNPTYAKHFDTHIEYHKNLIKIITAGQTKVS